MTTVIMSKGMAPITTSARIGKDMIKQEVEDMSIQGQCREEVTALARVGMKG